MTMTKTELIALARLVATEVLTYHDAAAVNGVADALEAAEAKVAAYRKWAIQPWPRAMTAGTWQMCRICGKGWEGTREIHGTDCPAAPETDAPTAQVVTRESRPDVWAKLQPPDVPLATLDARDHAGRRPGEGESANRAP